MVHRIEDRRASHPRFGLPRQYQASTSQKKKNIPVMTIQPRSPLLKAIAKRRAPKQLTAFCSFITDILSLQCKAAASVCQALLVAQPCLPVVLLRPPTCLQVGGDHPTSGVELALVCDTGVDFLYLQRHQCEGKFHGLTRTWQ